MYIKAFLDTSFRNKEESLLLEGLGREYPEVIFS